MTFLWYYISNNIKQSKKYNTKEIYYQSGSTRDIRNILFKNKDKTLPSLFDAMQRMHDTQRIA